MDLMMSDRFGNTGENSLNTQLRMGLYNGPSGSVTLEDIPNLGLFIVYGNHNQASNRRIRQLTSSTNVNPFSGTDNIGDPGTEDDGQDSIRGANPGPVHFEITLTRNLGLLDIAAQISGTNSVTGNPYISNYAFAGYDPAAIGGFTFNRAGFFFGANVDAPSATLADTVITTNVPEPRGVVLASLAMISGVVIARRVQGAGGAGKPKVVRS
jgi:hypothetical protein